MSDKEKKATTPQAGSEQIIKSQLSSVWLSVVGRTRGTPMARKRRREQSRCVTNQTEHFLEKRAKNRIPQTGRDGEIERGRYEESMSCPTRAGYIFYTCKSWA